MRRTSLRSFAANGKAHLRTEKAALILGWEMMAHWVSVLAVQVIRTWVWTPSAHLKREVWQQWGMGVKNGQLQLHHEAHLKGIRWRGTAEDTWCPSPAPSNMSTYAPSAHTQTHISFYVKNKYALIKWKQLFLDFSLCAFLGIAAATENPQTTQTH